MSKITRQRQGACHVRRARVGWCAALSLVRFRRATHGIIRALPAQFVRWHGIQQQVQHHQHQQQQPARWISWMIAEPSHVAPATPGLHDPPGWPAVCSQHLFVQRHRMPCETEVELEKRAVTQTTSIDEHHRRHQRQTRSTTRRHATGRASARHRPLFARPACQPSADPHTNDHYTYITAQRVAQQHTRQATRPVRPPCTM